MPKPKHRKKHHEAKKHNRRLKHAIKETIAQNQREKEALESLEDVERQFAEASQEGESSICARCLIAIRDTLDENRAELEQYLNDPNVRDRAQSYINRLEQSERWMKQTVFFFDPEDERQIRQAMGPPHSERENVYT